VGGNQKKKGGGGGGGVRDVPSSRQSGRSVNFTTRRHVTTPIICFHGMDWRAFLFARISYALVHVSADPFSFLFPTVGVIGNI